MRSTGIIVETLDHNIAKLQMKQHSACAECGKCHTESESKDLLVEVDNSVGAKKGDFVEVDLEAANVLQAAAIAYLIPLAALLIGVIATNQILNTIGYSGSKEIASTVVGLITMVISYIIIKINDNKFKQSKKYMPVITNIVKSNGIPLDIVLK
jgi:sigma-E factor negative regulatory protein RseC